ncbi:MAG: NADH-quinone oxidoreductase subunit L [Nitrososphaerota archaeon]|nr:NADH-quinone oxidoreductase subunit L [Nitrososphaerota archaeon]
MNYLPYLIWASPFVASALVLALYNRKAAGGISIGSIAIATLISAYELAGLSGHPVVLNISWFSLGALQVNVGMLMDGLSTIMALVVAVISLLISIYSYRYMEDDDGINRYWFFFTFFVGSMLLLVLSNNLLLLLIGWEGTTLSSYALIGHWYTDEPERWVGDADRHALGVPAWSTPSEAAIRAIVFTSLADVAFITAIGMLYSVSGTFSISALASSMPHVLAVMQSRGILIPFLIAFSLGAFAKSAQFPFHEWLVTAMTGPSSISALIHAATMVNAGVYLLLRFTPMFISGSLADGLSAQIEPFFIYMLIIGALTAFMMASQATVAKELKLILAYSTASQIGYMFMAIGASFFILPTVALFAAFSHMISQAIFKAALFLVAGVLIHQFGSRYIGDMRGIWKYMKYSSIAFFLAALSLSGVPPFSGFWDKDLILDLTSSAGLWAAYVVGMVVAFLTAFYIFRVIVMTFQAGPTGKVKEAKRSMMWPYLLLGVAALLFGILWPYALGNISGRIYIAMTFDSIIRWAPAQVVSQIPFNLVMSVPSVAVSLAGVFFAYFLYRGGKQPSFSKGNAGGVFGAIYTFLYDRWFINAVYYRVFVNGLSELSTLLGVFVEAKFFDGIYHNYIPNAFARVSGRFRKLQSGDFDRFIGLMFLGLLALIIIFLIFLR